MLRTRLFVPMLFLTLVAMSAAQEKDKSFKFWSSGINITSNNEDSDVCADHLRIHSSRALEVLNAEESRTLPNQPLRINASRNGGIHVRAWAKPEIGIKVCKSAAGPSAGAAQKLLEKIALNVHGSTVTVTGPEKDGGWDDDVAWSSVVLVFAPAGATLDMEAFNGGISLHKVNGNFTAQTRNGGIALREARGKIDVETTNGGLSIKDCGGEVKATAQNGGLSIELAETWDGAGLDARTHNGGMVVAVPRTMQSGVELELSRHSGVVCQAEACSSGNRSWDDRGGRTIRFGSGTTLVRASTVNGGTVIKERGKKMGKL